MIIFTGYGIHIRVVRRTHGKVYLVVDLVLIIRLNIVLVHANGSMKVRITLIHSPKKL